jgi:D-aspartate ligase
VVTPPAYVLRLGPSGLTVVRALGRCGVPVVALYSDPQDPAARSRYARAKILPPLEDREDAWLQALLEEGHRLGSAKAVIFPIGDEGWLFLARHREALGQYFRFALPQADNLIDWPGKPFQYRVALEAGLPVPQTFFPRNEEEALGAAVLLGFPCVLKPAYSHQWQAIYGWEKLACVMTADEVLARWRDAMTKGLSVVLQEYIPGGDDQFYVVHSYLDRDSRPLATGVVKKIRQYPPHFGASCVSMSVADPGIAEPIKKMGLAMLQAMKFHGIGGVEFKRHERTGELKLIEVNVRPGTMTAVVIDGGLNLPYIAYCDLLGRPGPLLGPFRGGRKVVLIGRDVKSFRYYRGRGELTWWQWGRSLLGRTREYYFGWDDPAPFIGQLRRLVRGAVG